VAEVVLTNVASDAYDAWSGTEAKRGQLLAAIEECVATLPRQPALRVFRCSLLDLAGRGEEAYVGALEALELPFGTEQDRIRTALVRLVDQVALDEIPEAALRPTNPTELETTIAVAARALRLFPRSHRVRLLLVQALQKRPDGSGEHEAVQVLS